MSALAIRRLVILVFLGGIAGMIVGSIRDNNGMAITFGLITAAAAVGLILVTSVAPPGSFRTQQREGDRDDAPGLDEAAAADVERRIAVLVDAGADETQVRELVQRSLDMTRGPIRRH